MKTVFSFRFARAVALKVGVAGIVAVAALSGCDQNFNLSDLNSPSPETASPQSLVTGTLANWRYTENNEFLGTMGRESYTSAADDPRILGEPITDGIDPGAFVATRPWANMYYTIANARKLVEVAGSLSAQQKAGLEGVAKTIWAHELVRLSNMWYDKGIKIEYKFDLSASFVNRQQSLAEAARLLDEANTALSGAGASFAFKLGDGFKDFDTPAAFAKANRAWRARVAAYQSDYATCLTALAASFLKEGKAAADMAIGVSHVYTTQPGDVAPAARGGAGGNPFYQNIAAPSARWWAHAKYFSDNKDNTVDTRVTQKTVTPANIKVPATITGASGLTATRVVNIYPTNTYPTSIIRNEELLLLRAEARLLGSTKDYAGATADLNRVRTAAGAPEIATLTEANALAQLLYERRYSLFFEGHRWVDLKRFNRLSDIQAERSGDKVSTTGWPQLVRETPQ